MALKKEISVDKIEVLEMGQVQVRTVTRIIENETVISSSFHRHVLEPDAKLTGQDDRVKRICQAVWTPEVISAWESFKQAQTT